MVIQIQIWHLKVFNYTFIVDHVSNLDHNGL